MPPPDRARGFVAAASSRWCLPRPHPCICPGQLESRRTQWRAITPSLLRPRSASGMARCPNCQCTRRSPNRRRCIALERPVVEVMAHLRRRPSRRRVCVGQTDRVVVVTPELVQQPVADIVGRVDVCDSHGHTARRTRRAPPESRCIGLDKRSCRTPYLSRLLQGHRKVVPITTSEQDYLINRETSRRSADSFASVGAGGAVPSRRSNPARLRPSAHQPRARTSPEGQRGDGPAARISQSNCSYARRSSGN